MNKTLVSSIILALFACLLLAGCQADGEEEIVESAYKSLVKLTTGDSADLDNFGFAVSLGAEYALVGAPGADGGGTDRGEAYLFLRSQGGLDGWGLVKTLGSADAANSDYFGIAVDISGDDVVVGAVGENGAGTNQGAAYVFHRDQGGADNWGQVKKIVASDRADSDGFGYSAAIDGDTIVVGSDGEDGAGTNRGAAYVFSKDQGGIDNWGQVVKLVSPEPADNDQFGYAVSVQGDRILVGAPFEDGDGSDRGAVYLFERDLGGPDAWGLVRRIVPGAPTDDSWFGSSLSIDGSLAVVGEPWDDEAGTDCGAAYVFGRDQGGADNWGFVTKLLASDGAADAYFGYSLSIDGTNIVVGASHARGGGTERGQAYVFARDEGGPDNWGEVQRLRASDGANSDWFGISSAILGSYVLIGACGEDGSGTDQGAAYMFKKI